MTTPASPDADPPTGQIPADAADAPHLPPPVELDDARAIAELAALDEVDAAGLEALLFLADEPMDVVQLGELLELAPEVVDAACQGLAARHRLERRGTEVRRAAGGWRMYSAALARPVLERWALTGRTGRLTQAALETLAVIAYKQPIGRGDIGEIRGVNADGAVRSLVARGLVTEVGRDAGPGQAVLYGTTTMLLERLGIDSLDQLPPLTEFLPEHAAPDEPELARLKEVRRKLAAGGELPEDDRGVRQAAARRFGDVRARLAAAGGEEAQPSEAAADDDELDHDDLLPPPSGQRTDRRPDDAAMDELSDRLEVAARSAVDRLRRAVSATEEREGAEGSEGSEGAEGSEGTEGSEGSEGSEGPDGPGEPARG